MKITMCCGQYLPALGGYCLNSHELARRLTMQGHDVTVMTTAATGPVEIDGVHVVRLPSWEILNGSYPIPKPGARILRGIGRPDVVITHTRFFPICAWGAWSAVRGGVPLIHVERGSRHSVVESGIVDTLSRTYDHTVGRWIISHASAVVGISQAACAFAHHLGAKRLALIPNGAGDVPARTVHKGPARVVYANRLIQAKGIQDLIQAFDRVSFPLRLVIIGDGNYRQELERAAHQTKHHKWIEFTGQLSHTETLRRMAQCDIFVSPSYSEGLPTAVLEAARIGLPIVATDVGGTREIVNDSGMLIAPHDIASMSHWIEFLASNTEKAIQWGWAARETSKRFDWGLVVTQWERLLQEVT